MSPDGRKSKIEFCLEAWDEVFRFVVLVIADAAKCATIFIFLWAYSYGIKLMKAGGLEDGEGALLQKLHFYGSFSSLLAISGAFFAKLIFSLFGRRNE